MSTANGTGNAGTLGFDDRSGAKGEGAPTLSASHLAKQLGLCSRILFRWAAAGKITRYKINAGVVLFDRKEVLAVAKGRHHDPESL